MHMRETLSLPSCSYGPLTPNAPSPPNSVSRPGFVSYVPIKVAATPTPRKKGVKLKEEKQ